MSCCGWCSSRMEGYLEQGTSEQSIEWMCMSACPTLALQYRAYRPIKVALSPLLIYPSHPIS